MHSPATRTCTIKADLAVTTAERPICQLQRPALSPRHRTIPWGDPPKTWWQADHAGSHSTWKGLRCILTGRHVFFWIWICLPCTDSLKAVPTVVTAYSVASDQRPTAQPQRGEGPGLTESTGLTMFPPSAAAN
jgi:hypothetical protein